jgi:hypothetical protein
MLAFSHIFPEPVHDPVLDEFLDLFLREGNVMSVFVVLGMKRKNKRQVEIACLPGGGLSQQKWMMRMDDIQLQPWKELVNKRRDRQCRGDITRQREFKTGIAEDKGFRVFIIILLGEYEDVMSEG